MDLVGKIHTCVCTFLGVYVGTVLLIGIYLNFNKALNNVLNYELVNKTETYGSFKCVIKCICKSENWYLNNNVNYDTNNNNNDSK